MDQIKDRIKLVDTTLLSLEQVYTTLSHVSLKKKSLFCLLRSYFIVGVHNKSVRKGGRAKLLRGQNSDIQVANFCFCSLHIFAKNEGGGRAQFPPTVPTALQLLLIEIRYFVRVGHRGGTGAQMEYGVQGRRNVKNLGWDKPIRWR